MAKRKKRFVAGAAAVLALCAACGCYGPRGAAPTPEERRINVGASPGATKGKEAGALMDSKLVPAPSGVRTGTAAGKR